MPIVHQLIEQYQLQPHPEGGWYVQTYKSSESIPAAALPSRFAGDRYFSSAIYFLLEEGNFSAFHRIQSDECWHFYSGDPLELLVFHPGGELSVITLGSDNSRGQRFQYVVPAGCWFASRPAAGSRYSFVGCTVAPAFDFTDFELADGEQLAATYPAFATLVKQLCR